MICLQQNANNSDDNMLPKRLDLYTSPSRAIIDQLNDWPIKYLVEL